MARPDGGPRRALDGEDAACLLLLETLADTDPVPDTSAIGLDRKRLLALLAEISKGERSGFLRRIAEVAERRGIAPQEIAGRAGFLLACLDAPGSDDYYQILGVLPTATPQEIRETWISRVSLYHPDRHPEKADWFTHQVARMNEAYNTLKDPERRREYDERRREALHREQRDASALRPAAGKPRMSVVFGDRLRRWLPAIITGGSAIAAGLITLFLLLPGPPTPPEATPFPSSDAPRPASERASRGKPGGGEQAAAQWPAKEGTAQPSAEGWPASKRPVPSARPDVRAVFEPSKARMFLAQALPPITAEPRGLERQEIDALLDQYVEAYEKADLERLMATFSSRVREKGTLDYQAIRNLYARGFAGREQIIYRLKNVHVEIAAETAIVTAQYLISARGTNQPAKGTTVTGRIEWKIQREGDRPKIVSINY